MLRAFRWFALSLAGLALTGGILGLSHNDDLKLVAAIAGLFLLLPLAILTYKDGARAVALTSPSRSARSLMLGLPLQMLGAVSFGVGATILAWVGYNLLISRHPVFTGVKSLGQLVLPLVLVVAGLRWMRRPLSRAQNDEIA